MAATIPANPSAQLQTALKWVDGLNRWDLDQMLSACAEDYTHYILPKSLGVPTRNKTEWKEYFASVMPTFQDFKMTILEIIEAPGKVMLYASSTATSATGLPYTNEYNLVMHLTPQPDGLTKISLMKEFLDGKLAVEFFIEEGKRQAAKQQA